MFMKTLLLCVILLVATRCATTKEINVEMVNAQLIRIDTVYRNTDHEKQQLTWRDGDNIEYTSLVSMTRTYSVGIVMPVLRRR
jgi:hypothetical protein